MDADGESRAHFMVVAKKDEQVMLDQSGDSTPELPKKIQKVSIRPDFSHGCEILAADEMSPVASLPGNNLETTRDVVSPIGDGSSNVPENDCVPAPETTPPSNVPDPSSDLPSASFPMETPLDAIGDLKDGDADTSSLACSLLSANINEPGTVPAGIPKQTDDTADRSNGGRTNEIEGKTLDSATESASEVSARERTGSEAGETTSSDLFPRMTKPDVDCVREKPDPRCNVFGGQSLAVTGGDLEGSKNQGCTKLINVGPNGRERDAQTLTDVSSIVLVSDQNGKTDKNNVNVSPPGDDDVLAEDGALAAGLKHTFLSCWKKSFETTAYKTSEVWRGHRWGLGSVATNASNGLGFTFGPKTPHVDVRHFGAEDSPDRRGAANPSPPLDGAAKPSTDSKDATTTPGKGFRFLPSADAEGGTQKTVKTKNSRESSQTTEPRVSGSFVFPLGAWSCQTSNFGVARSGSFFSNPFGSSAGQGQLWPVTSSLDAPPASQTSTTPEGSGLPEPANAFVDTIPPQTLRSDCTPSSLKASNAINVFRFSKPDARPPNVKAPPETAVQSIWPTSSGPSTSRDVSAGGDATGFNFPLTSPMELPKCSKYQYRRLKTKSVRAPQRQTGPPPVSAIEASVLRSLECPVCLEPCTPPIYTCLEGHHVCSACRHRIKACAVCKAPMSAARNWLAEDISLKIVKTLCKNAQLGCSKRLYTKDMLRHVRVCPWSVCCTVLDRQAPCPWRGPMGELAPHVRATHPVTELGPQSTERPVLPGTSDNVLINVRGALYQCHLEYSQPAGGWHAYARHLGQPDSMPNASCEFELYARDAHFRLRYVDRVLHFPEKLRKDSLLVVNGKLVENLLQGGHEVFYTVKMICE